MNKTFTPNERVALEKCAEFLDADEALRDGLIDVDVEWNEFVMRVETIVDRSRKRDRTLEALGVESRFYGDNIELIRERAKALRRDRALKAHKKRVAREALDRELEELEA